jgi:SAM-dependent methyltransferase
MVTFEVHLPGKPHGRGFNCLIAHDEQIARDLEARYGRKGLCLKIFKRKRPVKMNPVQAERTWGPKPACTLEDCVRVQNLYAMEGLAPRVYDIARVNQYPALVTDFVTGKKKQVDRDRQKRCLELADDLGLYRASHKTFRHEPNWIGGKFVDFGSCCWAPNKRAAYKQALVEMCKASNGSKRVYQQVPELGITKARRDIGHRLQVMRLVHPGKLFESKDVLDLGCSLGAFTRYAAQHGARRVVGLDDTNAVSAYELSNWLKCWNIDFKSATLPTNPQWLRKQVGVVKFDVIFALAIIKWTGGRTLWVKNLLKPGGIVYFESHDRHARELQDLSANFSRVDELGLTKDLGVRRVYRCIK